MKASIISRERLRLLLSLGIAAMACIFGYQLFASLFGHSARHGDLNISCFTYRDVNRNGSYDTQDRPYAGMAVELRRPAGAPVGRLSNIGGFANFKMFLNNRKFDIHTPGKYQITAIAPEGWVITSKNRTQIANFKKLTEAPAGIILEKTLEPVGIAPELTISGTVDPKHGVEFLKATPPGGRAMTVPVSESGEYEIAAKKGEWSLKFITAEGPTGERTVTVGDYAVVVSRFHPAVGGFSAKTAVQRVGFDSLTPSDTLYEIPNGYAGLNWTNWIATHQRFYNGAGYINATVSSEYMAYNSSGHPATIWSDQPFDFAGASLGVAWDEATEHDVIIRAWRGEDLVHEDRIRATTAGPVYFDADYHGITRLEFSHEAYWQIVLDDFEFRTGNADAAR